MLYTLQWLRSRSDVFRQTALIEGADGPDASCSCIYSHTHTHSLLHMCVRARARSLYTNTERDAPEERVKQQRVRAFSTVSNSTAVLSACLYAFGFCKIVKPVYQSMRQSQTISPKQV